MQAMMPLMQDRVLRAMMPLMLMLENAGNSAERDICTVQRSLASWVAGERPALESLLPPLVLCSPTSTGPTL